MSEFRRQQRSYLRQLAFWAETVAKLGEEVTRPPTESESNRGISSWLVRIAPPHLLSETCLFGRWEIISLMFTELYFTPSLRISRCCV